MSADTGSFSTNQKMNLKMSAPLCTGGDVVSYVVFRGKAPEDAQKLKLPAPTA